MSKLFPTSITIVSCFPNSQVGSLSSLEIQTNVVSQAPFVNASNETTFTKWSILPTVSNFVMADASEILAGYYDLGESLGEMNELEVGDDWKIDDNIFNAACIFAGKLLEYSYPPPKIFNHGPKSIVFGWSGSGRDTYLTIASRSASTLVTESGEITHRRKYPIAQLDNHAFALQILPPMQFALASRMLSSASTDGSDGSSI